MHFIFVSSLSVKCFTVTIVQKYVMMCMCNVRVIVQPSDRKAAVTYYKLHMTQDFHTIIILQSNIHSDFMTYIMCLSAFISLQSH